MTSLPVDVRDPRMRLESRVTSALHGMIPAFIADRSFRTNSPDRDPYGSHVHIMSPPPAYFLNDSSVSFLPPYPHDGDIELGVFPPGLDRRPGFLLGGRPTVPRRAADRNAWYKGPLLVILLIAIIAAFLVLSMFIIPKMKSHETLPHPPPLPDGSATPAPDRSA